RTRAIAAAKTKTDQIDAATLAQLLAADYLPEVWQPDAATQALRRLVAHRAGLVRGRTGARNRVHAICARRLLSAPVSDLFGVAGRAWLDKLVLEPDERLALDAQMRLLATLEVEIDAAERAIAAHVLDDRRVRQVPAMCPVGSSARAIRSPSRRVR
ncbi:MAG TPA: transposase, partial [Candidatus Limnocylindrales bacterium]